MAKIYEENIQKYSLIAGKIRIIQKWEGESKEKRGKWRGKIEIEIRIKEN